MHTETASIHSDCFPMENFPAIEDKVKAFRASSFLALPIHERYKKINQTLCELIQKAPQPCFLLHAVIHFFDLINQEKCLFDKLDMAGFEFWLNQFSHATIEENYLIRAKIVGKHIPRQDYQAFFPVGMGKSYFGTHFVSAHLSPDVDTMIASFSGWQDAFAARVGSGVHLWCLPGGAPNSPVTSIFRKLFGQNIFRSLAREKKELNLTAMDLMTRKCFSKDKGSTLVGAIEHGLSENAVILVSREEHYLADWRISDVEPVGQITILFKACLHWFENNFHANIISLFAKKDLSTRDLPDFYASIFGVRICDAAPARDFNEKQKKLLDDFFFKVLDNKFGFQGTFGDLNKALDHLSLRGMLSLQRKVEDLPASPIFDSAGSLKENRPEIFNYLKELIRHLDEAIFEARVYVERLDVVCSIKQKVLGRSSTYLTLSSDVDEIREKMENHDFLTVVTHDGDNVLFPLGVVRAKDLRENGLGTVSWRDFSNFEEVRMAPYLEVISVVDHHKSALKTPSVSTMIVGDAQSCNVIIAEQTFLLNDRYSLGGMNKEQIEKQIQEISTSPTTLNGTRILQRLLQRRIASEASSSYFIHPSREFSEYLFFLHAILDDTDLLSKVSFRDLACVVQLLNRLKSLSNAREVEVISLDDIPVDSKYLKAAAQRILQQPDMYSLYSKIYELREAEIESDLAAFLQNKTENLFIDTKEQNGCARIGQVKLFSSNIPFFLQHAGEIRKKWAEKAALVNKEKPEIDLCLQMISTIASAAEMYKNQRDAYSHQDELWFWIPLARQGYLHLTDFLAGFQQAIKDFQDTLSLEFIGATTPELIKIFDFYFPNTPKKHSSPQENNLVTILRFKPGSLNSRKAMISPYLPRLP